MRICVPTEMNSGLKAEVFGHFGSAPYFTVVDIEKKSVETIRNVDQHHGHGMCHPMGVLAAKKIDAVVCAGMGVRAIQKLNEAAVKVFQAQGRTVEDIIKAYQHNDLTELTVENACAQHHGCHEI